MPEHKLRLKFQYHLSGFFEDIHVRSKNYRNVTIYIILFAILAVESNHDILNLNAATIEAENRDFLGNAYLRKKQPDRALIEYRKSIEADPTYARGYNNIGTVLTRKGRFAEAAGFLKQAIRLDPRLAEPYINLSIGFSETADTASAIRILEEARRRFPANSHVHVYLAMAYSDARRIDQAMAAVRESLNLDPTNQTAKWFIGELQKSAVRR